MRRDRHDNICPKHSLTAKIILPCRNRCQQIIENTTPEQLGCVLEALKAPARQVRQPQVVADDARAETLTGSECRFVGNLPSGKVVPERNAD